LKESVAGGRWWSLAGGAFAMGTFMLIIAVLGATHPPHPKATQDPCRNRFYYHGFILKQLGCKSDAILRPKANTVDSKLQHVMGTGPMGQLIMSRLKKVS
jgi:hypothetical protein